MREKSVKIIGNVAWLTAAFLAGFLFGSEAHAQEGGAVCTDRKGAGEKLALKYQEARVNMGLASSGHVIEVFAKEDGSKFTIIMTSPEGVTCMMAAGENWEQVPFNLGKKIRYGNPL